MLNANAEEPILDLWSSDEELSDPPSSLEDQAELNDDTQVDCTKVEKPTSTEETKIPNDPSPLAKFIPTVTNPYAPNPRTHPAAASAYAREVAGLSLHATRSPTDCVATSKVPPLFLQLINDYLFHGIRQKDCLALYNKRGGKGRTPNCISKPFLMYADMWYAEEGVVKPWKARKTVEKDMLKQKGLDATNFPFVHPKDLEDDRRRHLHGGDERSA